MQSDSELDHWATWLKQTRYGNDAAQKRLVTAEIRRIIRRMLRRVVFRDGMTILDIGSGDGIAAEALVRRGGPTLRVIVSDVSSDALDHARQRMRKLGAEHQCRFLETSAESLDSIGAGTIDAIVCRASYAYVPDKQRAAAEFQRVLVSGGVVSMAEPIALDESLMSRALRQRVEESGDDLFLDLVHRWKSAQYPDTLEASQKMPLVNFSERDLLNFFLKAGFTDIHLRLWLDVGFAPAQPWETFINSSPHPLAPTLGAIFTTRFSAAERQFFEQRMRPIVTSGSSLDTRRLAFLWARKSADAALPAVWLKS